VARTSRRAEKPRTHERILDQASRAFREHGVSGVSIPALVNSIGLTHGAFYAHFGSKEALVADTYAKRIDDFIDGLLTSADDAAPRNELEAVLDGYLSAAHRDDRGSGCAFAALAADVGREKSTASLEFSDAIRR